MIIEIKADYETVEDVKINGESWISYALRRGIDLKLPFNLAIRPAKSYLFFAPRPDIEYEEEK